MHWFAHAQAIIGLVNCFVGYCAWTYLSMSALDMHSDHFAGHLKKLQDTCTLDVCCEVLFALTILTQIFAEDQS